MLPLVLLIALSPAKAEIYKWVDAAGNIHYGDNPPKSEFASKVSLPEPATYKSNETPPKRMVPQELKGIKPSDRSAVMLDDAPLQRKKLSPGNN